MKKSSISFYSACVQFCHDLCTKFSYAKNGPHSKHNLLLFIHISHIFQNLGTPHNITAHHFHKNYNSTTADHILLHFLQLRRLRESSQTTPACTSQLHDPNSLHGSPRSRPHTQRKKNLNASPSNWVFQLSPRIISKYSAIQLPHNSHFTYQWMNLAFHKHLPRRVLPELRLDSTERRPLQPNASQIFYSQVKIELHS